MDTCKYCGQGIVLADYYADTNSWISDPFGANILISDPFGMRLAVCPQHLSGNREHEPLTAPVDDSVARTAEAICQHLNRKTKNVDNINFMCWYEDIQAIIKEHIGEPIR